MDQTDENLVVHMQQVNKWFGEFHAMKDIDLSVYEGERIVVCGPSGSGKSTLIRCLNGLEKHQSGTIDVHGTRLGDDAESVRQIRENVGMVFQQFNLFPHLTVLENCILAPMTNLRLSETDASKLAMRFLERVQIPDQANKLPGQLSGGQQQRVAIARTLLKDPPIIILDEPLNHLDLINKVEIFSLLQQLCRTTNKTIIISTHQVELALQAADQLWLITNDHQLSVSTPDDAITNGVFDKAFKSDKVTFDKQSKTFQLRTNL